MCSKLKLSKNVNVPQEINLKIGQPIRITDVNGRQIVDVFQGFLTMEKWNSYWKQRSSAIYITPISAFTEGLGSKAKTFNMKVQNQGSPGPAVAFITSKGPNGDLGLRLATQPAIPQVARVHGRMPALIKENYQPKFAMVPEVMAEKAAV